MKKRQNTYPDILKMQCYIANIAISPSTLRNQGAKNVIATARTFLSKDILLKRIPANPKRFINYLNKQTKSLMNLFPGRAKGNWGAARKALNVFFELAYYNKFLCEAYKLNEISSYLELPLDSYSIKYLKEHGLKLDSFSIRKLKSTESDKIQCHAMQLAKRIGAKRIFLDLNAWRAKS